MHVIFVEEGSLVPTILDQSTMEKRMTEEILYRKQLPGMSAILSLEAVSCDAGKQQIEVFHKAEEWAKNVNGTMHGGIIAAVLDSAMGILCRCYAYPHRGPTINLNVNYLRTVHTNEKLFVRAELLRKARNLIWVRAIAWVDDPEKPRAAAEGTFYYKETCSS